jgi:hypothetical protein
VANGQNVPTYGEAGSTRWDETRRNIFVLCMVYSSLCSLCKRLSGLFLSNSLGIGSTTVARARERESGLFHSFRPHAAAAAAAAAAAPCPIAHRAFNLVVHYAPVVAPDQVQ